MNASAKISNPSMLLKDNAKKIEKFVRGEVQSHG
jgi:hypothetical protein